METEAGPRITGVERLAGGLLVTFDDGKCALFAAALLYGNLANAQAVDTSEEDLP